MIEHDKNHPPPLTSLRQSLARLWLRLRGFTLFSAGIAAALLAMLVYTSLMPEPDLLTEQEINEAVSQALASATPPPSFSSQVYQVIQPSLVLIQTRLDDPKGRKHEVLGSGVVINDQGDILTSLHVVDNAREIQIYYADGTEAKGEVIATQPENDIAVLGSDTMPEMLIPAILGNPNTMRVGDEVFAVGNPFGLYSSVSAGVISGFGRSFQPIGREQELEELIQFDAAVNPGNSGGPLLNRYGHVIGIVVGIVNPTDDEFFIGIGFAVPISIAGGAAEIPSY